MQKCNLEFSLLKFKIQMKIQHKDLLTCFDFVIYNGFDISIPSIAGYNASKYYFYYLYYQQRSYNEH